MTLRIVLTQEENGKHIHLCGKTGAEIEVTRICKKCKRKKPERFEQCLQSHSVIGLDEDVTEEQVKSLFSKEVKES